MVGPETTNYVALEVLSFQLPTTKKLSFRCIWDLLTTCDQKYNLYYG